MNFCINCLSIINLTQVLCDRCLKRINNCKEFKIIYIDYKKFKTKICVYTLFKYQDVIRDMILMAKVNQNLKSIYFLNQIIKSDRNILKLLKWAHIIVPVPSSLWSRFYGKYDLTYYIAQSLSDEFKKPLLTAPFDLFWKVKKRAMNHETLPYLSIGLIDKIKKAFKKNINVYDKNVLIVDDVITTGFTLKTVVDRITANNQIKVLTIANALNCNRLFWNVKHCDPKFEELV